MTSKERLEKMEIASQILKNLQAIQKEGVFGTKKSSESNFDMINKKIDELVEFIYSTGI